MICVIIEPAVVAVRARNDEIDFAVSVVAMPAELPS